jgi:glucose-1-phosphate thymidylyltransferase
VKGVILSGGLGTRLRPLTHTGAKQLIPIANKPVLEYCIEDLKETGISEIAIIVGYTPERIQSVKDIIGDGSRWGIRITYIEQDAPRGIAHAVYCAKDFIGNDDFVVYLGDNILRDPISAIIQNFHRQGLDAGMLLAEEKDPRPYGVAIMDNDTIVGIVEKPHKPPSNLVVIGVYYFSPRVFPVIEQLKISKRGELEISDTLHTMITSPDFHTGATRIQGWWDDTGTSEAVLRANHLMLTDISEKIEGTIEEGVTLIGTIAIGKGTIIKTGSVIRGPVIIGRNCTIGPTCIGPYSSIGDNCTIHGGEIGSSILVGDTIIDIEPNKRITDSLIGRHSLIYSARKRLPHAYKLTIGENSEVHL